MNTFIQWFRFLHIAAGFLAFVLAPVALLTLKGGKIHRRFGKLYFYSMAMVTVTALVLSMYRPILFLALVAVFSFYNAVRGYRVLYRKRPGQGQGPKLIDWGAASITLIMSLGLIAFGVIAPHVVFGHLRIPAIVFGMLGTLLAGSDIYSFIRPPADKNFWWYEHMGGMIGSYIAAWSAFSVVVLGRYVGNSAITWLWPSAIGVPGIFIWIAYYRHKFSAQGQVAAAAS